MSSRDNPGLHDPGGGRTPLAVGGVSVALNPNTPVKNPSTEVITPPGGVGPDDPMISTALIAAAPATEGAAHAHKAPATPPLYTALAGSAIASTPMPESSGQVPPPSLKDHPPAEPRQTPAQTPAVWSATGTAAMLRSLTGTTSDADPIVEGPANPTTSGASVEDLQVHYQCALRHRNLRLDGAQRLMTEQETKTLFMWYKRKIHLDKVPFFVGETHTTIERNMFSGFHKAHLGYRIYILLPVGSVIPAANSVQFFWNRLTTAAGQDTGRVEKVKRLFSEVHTTTCEFQSQMVVMRFTRPNVRDGWRNVKLGYGKSAVTLKATDSLSSEDPTRGFDPTAIELLYHIMLVGKHDLTPAEVHAIGAAAAGTAPVQVDEVEQTGFGPHQWKITYGQTACPKALLNMRRFNVSKGELKSTILVHHPRSSFRFPCDSCLSTRHTKKDCQNAHKEESLARHSKTVVLAPTIPDPHLVKYKTQAIFTKRLSDVRSEFFPDLRDKLQVKLAERQRQAAAAQAVAILSKEKEAATAAALLEKKRLQQQSEAEKSLRKVFSQSVTRQVREWNNTKTAARTAELAKAATVPKKGKEPKKAKELQQSLSKRKASPGSNSQVQTPEESAMATTVESAQSIATKQSQQDQLPAALKASGAPVSPPRKKTAATVAKSAKPQLFIDTTATSGASGAQPGGSTVSQCTSPGFFSIGTAPTKASPKATPRLTGHNYVNNGAESPRAGKPRSTRSTKPKSSRSGRSPFVDGIAREALAARLQAATGVALPLTPKRVASFIPIDMHFGAEIEEEIQAVEWRAKQEEDRASPPRATKTPQQSPVEAQLATGTAANTTQQNLVKCDDESMPYGVGVISPKKRGRRVKAALDADGDASMTKAHATDEPASKKERRPASGTKAKFTRGKTPVEATYVESSDDFLSESEQLPNYRRPTQLQPPAAAPVGGVNVPLVQTSVTEFFKDRPTGFLGSSSPTGATAQHDVSFDYSSLEEDTKIAKPKLLETLHVWLQQLRAHIVDNVGNGWCLMHAMDAAYRQEVKGKRLLDDDRAIDEAEYFKDLAATYELHYLDQMIADKTVHLPTLHARYYGLHAPAAEDANMRAEVEDFVYTTLELHCDEDISVERWGGPEEIMGLVWGLRQLILIFSVRTSGKVEVQMYHIEQASPPSPYDEIVKIRTVGLERAFVIIQTLLNHHVIPLVLVHKGDPCGGHFQTMRFAQHLYYDWNDEDQESEPMHHRYEEALRKLDIYVTVQRPLLPTAVRPITGPIPAETVDLSGSVFVPSDSATSAGGESSQDEADDRLTPLTLAQRSRLYQALNSHQRLRGERAQLWKAAETQNLLVLQTSLDEEGSADDLIATPNAMTAAFGRRAQQPHAAVRLLRRLPYPLVAIAARPTGIITRLGRELAMTGRSARFGEWKAALSGPDAQALDDLTAIPASTTTDERWRLAQDQTKWDAMSTLLGRDVSSHRSLPSTTEDQAMKLLVAIVATLPEDKPVADLCDQAHFWLSTNPSQAQAMLRDMRSNDWTSVASACRTISAAVPPDSPKSVTATGSFFRPTNNRTYRRQLHSDFRKLENSIAHRKRPKRKSPRSAIQHASLRTQNVRGLPKDAGKPELWFGLFRAKEEGAQPALTLVQETHVVHGEGAEMARRYRATWGFNANAAPMSFWSETDTRTGGVGILLNPYAVPHAAAAHESLWDGNFIAVKCAMEGHQVLVVSIYAPSDDVAKEVFFNKLADYKFQHDGPIVIGGDFNCTVFPALDRSYQAAAAAHCSPGLLRWIHAWQLVDALSESFPHEDADDAELKLFHADHHTYRYSVLEQLATSRLDRWYVSSGATSWASGVTTVDLGGGSDHASVVLQFSDPTGRAHVRRRPKLYPPKACAQSAIDEVSTAALTRLHDEYTAMASDGASASAFCHKWETFKSHLAMEMRKVTKTAVRKINMSYRTKIARIRRRLRAPGLTVSAASELERDLSTTAARWQGLKQRRKDAQLTQKQHSQTAEFFARAAAPRTRTTIARLDATEGRTRAPTDIANRMADGWREVFTQPPRDEVSTRFEHHLVPVLRENEAAGLALPFGTEELRRSLRRCKRTKSGGPDQLPNAWYRAHLDLLVPILQLLYNVCLAAGITPASFQTATIVCLQKAGRTTNPLGYRPISLLNTDYKVYMRLLTTRLKPLLPTMISESQGGFVPGRAIHDVIDCYAAAQHYATTRNTETIAILLDIKKAYDSLDRRFVDECLSQRGFPSEFRSAVAAAHTNTTARFEVNGRLSEPLSMTRGIRQGCPLAPMLFIVAMDPLYRRITHEPVLHEPLPDDPGILPPVAGYADDTALYLRDESCIASAMRVLDDFARVSGLQINKEKSVVIRLNPKAAPVAATHGLPGLPDGQMCRYLGAQIGRGITNQHIWKLVVQQIERRLAMAQVKTHSPAQRAVLAQYVIVSKVLFMARHHWPELPVVNDLDQRIRNFVWSGLFAVSSNPSTRTHRWMDMDLARLPHGAGGLGVPNLMTELHTMAAHVVASWAYNPAGAHGKIHELMGHSISPVQPKLYTSTPPMAPALQGSLWHDGRAGLEWCYGYQIKNPTRMLISDSITALRTLPRTWYRGVATRDYRAYYALAGKVILHDREKSEGRLNVLWLPHLEIRPDGSAMIHPDGGRLTQYHVKSLGHGTQLSDFVSWQWKSHGRVDFTPPCFPLSNSQADAFILLCDIIVANFPGILHRPDDEGQVRSTNVATPGGLEWFVPGDGFVHMRDHGFTVRTTQIKSQHDLQRQSPVHVDGKLTTPIFECGPSLTALAQPWTGRHPWRPQRRVLKRRLNAGSVLRGKAARGKRATKWREDDEDMYVAITNVPWHKFMTAAGLSTYEHQLWHRLRLHQLELWPKSTDCASCNTTDWTGSVGTGPAHIAWHCADAQTLWRDLATAWGAVGLSAGDLQLAVFSRRAPPTAMDWRAAFPERGTATVGDRLQHWISILWRQLVTCGLRRLWYNQVQRIYDPDQATLGNSFAARAAWARAVRGSITAVARSSDDHKELDQRVLRTLYQRLVTHTMEIPKFAGTTTTYVLFFDGGSRGNPGPGGSGSVIVQLYPEPQIVWAASMSYAAKSTTNNHAEYRGLCTGLTAAAKNAWHPLAVVGDSMMIIRQMQHRRPPRAATLLPWYEQARANADHIQVLGWHHHYRTYNKMADKAANQAMDTGASYQAHGSGTRPELHELRQWLPNDITYWVSSTFREQQRLCHNPAISAALNG